MIEPLAIIKDIFYTEVFFIWYLGNQLQVAGCKLRFYPLPS